MNREFNYKRFKEVRDLVMKMGTSEFSVWLEAIKDEVRLRRQEELEGILFERVREDGRK